ncbi:rhomboid family intramembrane serine protease [Mycolicibacterium sp.]|uniref:rhomboid family intramembrane serine protease n=1 Tax=Mycolicibacterium sp. TaxID=2320850 RepID=UPI0037CA8603
MTMPYPAQTPAGAPACYRHPDRQTYVSCTRCGRPVCPECMVSASVGHQCVDCVQAAAQSVPVTRTMAGGVMRTGIPLVSYTLIAVNVAVFVLQMASKMVVYKLALVPLFVAAGEYYRLATSAFVHFGLIHLLFNMWALYVLGPPLERHLGRLRFAALYGLSALGGGVMVYLFSPANVPTAGASGAIFGLFGATFVTSKRLNLDVRWLIGLIAVNLVITFSVPGISWQGHLGGLLVGALVAAVYVYAPRARRTLVQAGASIGLVVMFGVLIAARTATLLGG